MKSARRDPGAAIRAKLAAKRNARRARLPAGRARDRGNAALADRPRDGGTIIALFCLALVWAGFGKVDIVATAPGKIVSSGRTKIVQPFETGVIRAIHVQDGQQVKAGDCLIELDSDHQRRRARPSCEPISSPPGSTSRAARGTG